MGMITIAANDDLEAAGNDWPAFYMIDFSVLGLRVENIESAKTILETAGYQIVDGDSRAHVPIANHNDFKNIIHTLQKNGINFNISDLFVGAYQG